MADGDKHGKHKLKLKGSLGKGAFGEIRKGTCRYCSSDACGTHVLSCQCALAHEAGADAVSLLRQRVAGLLDGDTVAVKTMAPGQPGMTPDSEVSAQMFFREAEMLRKCKHRYAFQRPSLLAAQQHQLFSTDLLCESHPAALIGKPNYRNGNTSTYQGRTLFYSYVDQPQLNSVTTTLRIATTGLLRYRRIIGFKALIHMPPTSKLSSGAAWALVMEYAKVTSPPPHPPPCQGAPACPVC
jgi:hypothetical protein